MAGEYEHVGQEIAFLDAARPALLPGDHTVRVSQTVTDTRAGPKTLETFVRTQKLVVRGPRLNLDPSVVQGTYPPAGQEGDFANVLPHVVLSQATLPWQRCATAQADHAAPPWLAVLLFDQDDPPPTPQMTTAGKLADCPNGTVPTRGLVKGESADDPVTVIDVPLATFLRLAPGLDELRWLAHVRRVPLTRKAAGADPDKPTTDYAVVVSNRLCCPGRRYAAHLVSLDGVGVLLPGDGPPPTDVTVIRLVSLTSWSFTTIGDGGTFAAVLGRLDVAPLALPVAPVAEGDSPAARQVKGAIARGFGAFDHHLRDGSKTVSWYRGPLLPVKAASAGVPATCATSDRLLRYDPESGMFDVSFAAAWQLGRQLALVNGELNRAICRWKTHLIHEAALERQRAQAAGLGLLELPVEPGMARAMTAAVPAAGTKPLPELVRTGTTLVTCPFDAATLRNILTAPARPDADGGAPPQAMEEATIQGWLTRYALLFDIPINYLVPDANMVPEETIRFFHIDRTWQLALLDGVLSIGGEAIESEAEQRRVMIESALTKASPTADDSDEQGILSGFVLRSKAVEAWPGIEVQAFANGSDLPLVLTQMERVAPGGVLVCLFQGGLSRVDLIEPAESLYFGVDARPATRKDGDVVKLSSLAQSLGTGSAAAFAAKMARTGKLVTFKMEDPQS